MCHGMFHRIKLCYSIDVDCQYWEKKMKILIFCVVLFGILALTNGKINFKNKIYMMKNCNFPLYSKMSEPKYYKERQQRVDLQ